MLPIFLLLLIISTISHLCGMESPRDIVQEYDSQQQLACARNGMKLWDANKAREIFNYDLELNLIEEDPDEVAAGMHVFGRVMFRNHGFGGDGAEVVYVKGKPTNEIPGACFTYNLPDYELQRKISALWYTSFGGPTEVLPATYARMRMVMCGLQQWDEQGVSRGATTTIGQLGFWFAPGHYEKELERIGVNREMRTKLLNGVQCIVLGWPLRGLNEVIKGHIDNGVDAAVSSVMQTSSGQRSYGVFKSVGNTLQTYGGPVVAPLTGLYNTMWLVGKDLYNLSAGSSASSVDEVIMPMVTSYKPWAKTKNMLLALQRAKNEHNWKFCVVVQPDDVTVGNDKNKIQEYMELLPGSDDHKYLLEGYGGGHMRLSKDQICSIHAFHKEQGGSYKKTLAVQDYGRLEASKFSNLNQN
jgi:hypothetical protein